MVFEDKQVSDNFISRIMDEKMKSYTEIIEGKEVIKEFDEESNWDIYVALMNLKAKLQEQRNETNKTL